MARQQQNMGLWVLLGLGALWAFSQPRRPMTVMAAPAEPYSAAPGAPTPAEIAVQEAYRAQRAGEREAVDVWVNGYASPPAEEAVVYPGPGPVSTGPLPEGPRIPGYPEPRIIVESPFAAHGYRWY